MHKVINKGSVSVAGNRQPIPKDRLPAVAMIDWHVARHWAAGDGGGATSLSSRWRRRLLD